MGQAAVRNTAADFLLHCGFDRVSAIYKAVPHFFPDVAWQSPVPGDWTAMLAFNIDGFTENRIGITAAGNSFGAPPGGKMRSYQTSVLVHVQYALPAFPDPTEDAASYIDAQDDLIDQIIAAIHADPLMGSGDTGVIFQAGQDPNGITVQEEVARYNADQSGVFMWARIALALDSVEANA